MLAGVTAAVSVVAFLSPTIQANAQPEPTPPDDRVELIIFHGDGCPHCAKALDFLDGLQDREPLLDIVRYEVWYDKSNLALFESAAATHGIEALSVPTIFLGDLYWVGFDSTVGDQIEDAVEALTEGRVPEETRRTSVDVPFVGAVRRRRRPVPDHRHRPHRLCRRGQPMLLLGAVDAAHPRPA